MFWSDRKKKEAGYIYRGNGEWLSPEGQVEDVRTIFIIGLIIFASGMAMVAVVAVASALGCPA